MGNATLSIGGPTPYNALYGRQPAVLPDINAPPDDSGGVLPGLTRHVSRVREVAVQQMVEATSRAKLQRALATPTRVTGQEKGYKVGDLVDFHSPPGTKDRPGWRYDVTIKATT